MPASSPGPRADVRRPHRLNVTRLSLWPLALVLAATVTTGVRVTGAGQPDARRGVPPVIVDLSALMPAGPKSAGADRGGAAQASAAQGGWTAGVREDIARLEYEVSWQGNGAEPAVPAWQAPNRAHGFRTSFQDSGVEVTPRTEESPSWTWGLSLAGYGRGGATWSVPGMGPAPSKNRVEYHRGHLEEWYVNGPEGLEQGFELRSEPETAARQAGAEALRGRPVPPGRPVVGRPDEGDDADGPAARQGDARTPAERLLHLDFSLSGSLLPTLSADGQAVDFSLPTGARVLRYAALSVKDSAGRVLPAWMEGIASEAVRGIRIVVDDRDALYPITVDPMVTSPAWTADGGPQAGAWFGNSVATAGDVNGDGYSDVIIGAEKYDNGETDEGRAFVYLGSAGGLSITPAWTAEANQVGANFGYVVATAGDVNGDGYSDALVGAPLYDNGEVDEGRAYLYLGSATGLASAPAWNIEINQANAHFGDAVASAGDVNSDGYSDVIVGAPYFDNGEVDEGRAYVYLGSGSGLSTTAAWTAESDQASANFGFSVSTAGDVNGDGYSDVVIGAPFFDNYGLTDEGAAFGFHGTASGVPTTLNWMGESGQAGALFGWSVGGGGDLNGDGYADVLVGAPQYEITSLTDAGLVYQFPGSAGGLSYSDRGATVSQAFADVGYSVSIAGDVNGDGYADSIVGAAYYDNGEIDEGAGLFVPSGTCGLACGGASMQLLERNQAFAYSGLSVATAGDVNGDGYADLLVGAYAYDAPGAVDAGSVALYLGGTAGPWTFVAWNAESDQASSNSGFSTASAGDVNGDGYSDVLVGVPSYDNGQNDEGRVLLYLGGSTGLATTPAWTAESDQPSALFGFSVATAGDVNGDGFSDVLVGSYAFDNGHNDEGRAFVYLGSASGLGATPAWTAESDQPGAWFGASVATAGDVNGDGYSDVLVGAPLYDNGQTDEGRAFLYLGSSGGPAPASSWTAEINVGAARFGNSVSTAGDVNGDGYSDVIVGAPYQDTAILFSTGGAYVYAGSSTGLAGTPLWSLTGSQPFENFGWSVATAGDVNGDGYSDILVGDPAFDAPLQTDAGQALLYGGSTGGPSTLPFWSVQGGQVGAYYGWSVATAGDVNGDGFSDVLVGAPYFDNGQIDEGRAHIYLGSPAALATIPAWSIESDQAFADLGYSVASAGDVNGDGYSDVLVGAPYFDNGQIDEGRVLFFYGNTIRGTSVRPQQRRADNAAPIVTGLRSRTPGSLRLAALGHTTIGRNLFKLEWEIKPRGRAFDGTGRQRSAAWIDSGDGTLTVHEALSGLEPGAYHWRMRQVYRQASSPCVAATRWFSPPLNGAMETDVTVGSFIGGAVFEDLNGNGVRDAGEPPMARLTVYLQGSGGASTGATFTDNQGNYRFEILDTSVHRILFTLPSGYQYTLPDQGVDDALDSDADPFTGQTLFIGPPYQSADGANWGAGMLRIGPCVAPDEPIYIYNVRLSTDGKNYTILDYQDPNQPLQVTGYNVRRSSNPALPKSSWPILATNVVDMDAGTVNRQWVDTSAAAPPQGQVWYYEVTAYNGACGAEGPF